MEQLINRFLSPERCAKKKFSKRDVVFVKKLLLEFIQFKHKVEEEELKKMMEDEEEWDIFDASTHIQPKRSKVASTVSRSEDGDVVLSLGEEPQFCAQDERNDAFHIYIDSEDMLTNLVNAYTGGATNTPEVAGGDVEVAPLTKTKEQEAPAGRCEICPFCCEELPKNGLQEDVNNCDGDPIARNYKCAYCGKNFSTNKINVYRHLRRCEMN